MHDAKSGYRAPLLYLLTDIFCQSLTTQAGCVHRVEYSPVAVVLTRTYRTRTHSVTLVASNQILLDQQMVVHAVLTWCHSHALSPVPSSPLGGAFPASFMISL